MRCVYRCLFRICFAAACTSDRRRYRVPQKFMDLILTWQNCNGRKMIFALIRTCGDVRDTPSLPKAQTDLRIPWCECVCVLLWAMDAVRGPWARDEWKRNGLVGARETLVCVCASRDNKSITSRLRFVRLSTAQHQQGKAAKIAVNELNANAEGEHNVRQFAAHSSSHWYWLPLWFVYCDKFRLRITASNRSAVHFLIAIKARYGIDVKPLFIGDLFELNWYRIEYISMHCALPGQRRTFTSFMLVVQFQLIYVCLRVRPETISSMC